MVSGSRACFFPGTAAEPWKGSPPPNTHSLPPITAEAGTLIPVGRFARWVHVSVAPLVNDKRKVDGFVTIVEDITASLDAAGCYRRRDEAVRTVMPEFGGGCRC